MSTTKAPVTGFDFVRAFRQASEEVLLQLIDERPIMTPPVFVIGPSIDLERINICIGITGDLCGHVCLGVDPDTARAIAEAMIMEPIGELDELALSALCELTNMIAGHARTYVNQLGFVSDVTTPSVLFGDSRIVVWHDTRAVVVRLNLSLGSIRLTVGIRRKGTQSEC